MANRREFLKLTQGLTLATIAALNFGCSLQPKIKGKKVALIYATRYGATQDTAKWIAQGFNKDIDLFDVRKIDFDEVVRNYDYFIVGSGVWIGGVDNQIVEFLKASNEKVIATFIVCGTTLEFKGGDERIAKYFEKLHSPLKSVPKYNQAFGGQMQIERLTPKDRNLLAHFYKNIIKKEFKSWDRRDKKKANIFGKRLPINT